MYTPYPYRVAEWSDASASQIRADIERAAAEIISGKITGCEIKGTTWTLEPTDASYDERLLLL